MLFVAATQHDKGASCVVVLIHSNTFGETKVHVQCMHHARLNAIHELFEVTRSTALSFAT